MWWIYTLLSPLFASLTAIFAKLDIAGVDSNYATAMHSIVILFVAWGLVLAMGEASRPIRFYYFLKNQKK